jgi:ribonuclease VapC
MVIDSSAVIAIALKEPERMDFLQRIHADRRRLISAPTLLEMEIVLTIRQGPESSNVLNDFLRRLHFQVVPFDEVQAGIAREAFLRFGKGRHKAGLNFGDCFSYALAKQTGEPLLYKGNDFRETDIASA